MNAIKGTHKNNSKFEISAKNDQKTIEISKIDITYL